MLTAITKTGKKICLGYDYSKETLLLLRNKEEFVCPVCKEKVVLKLGDQRIFHFAHHQGSQCGEIYENETYEHLEGKRQLFQWLIKQEISSILEFYDPTIQQRPDIMFQYKGQRYALEYQCSLLPDKIFSKRTSVYLENSYIPLWVMSSKHLHQKRKDLISLSNFQYSFLRSSPAGRLYIPAYCSENRHFQIVDSITSFSIKNSFVHLSSFPLQTIQLDSILDPMKNHPPSLNSWNKEMDKFIFNWALHPHTQHKLFFQEVYNRGLNLFLLPPEIGLPVEHSVLIQTPPFIWQTYLFLDVLAKKTPFDLITIKEVNDSLQKRIQNKQIILRNLPQLKNIQPITALLEYLQLLIKLDILTRKSDRGFILQKPIKIPRSNSEREEDKKNFLTQHRCTLLK
ncbi:competence protein CoiA [Neobacillus cucumis]|uniref:Competence protein CoiA n=1 Tax=Neobacillus cucumis TaxID=1740721 RepID=A0A2N5HBM1_9BACI|nr:competence protein CoiA family protein [Neobacillus cucumis]PLS02921.1 hypothetical protein CVD27_17210 [Neobacillus cucumis]